jgi:tryptophan synthase alpha chain
LAAAGALAIEVGIPFSDPIADGPDIQRASEWAVRAGVGAREALELIRRFRRESQTPIVVMTYCNPVLRLGIEAFATESHAAGVDGVILSDLPPDESPDVWQALERAGLDRVLLVAPTTEDARLQVILARASGFVYCLSRTGVTGGGAGTSGPIAERIAALRARTPLPIAVGFGISSAADARALRGVADAIVVGAAFMRAVTADPQHGAVERTRSLAGELVAALRS